MSNRKNFYFRQRVTEGELDAAFDDLEDADHDLAGDLGAVGVVANAVVSPHGPVADLSVDISSPGIIYDQLGQRIFFSALQTVSVAQDENGVATSVSASTKERVVSVFAQFERLLSEERLDGNSQTVLYRRDESFKLLVAQGSEADVGQAAPPALRPAAVLLADVKRRFNQVQILAGDISVERRQDAIALPGTPRTIRRGRAVDALGDLLSLHNTHVAGLADRHAAAQIDYAGGPTWADGTTTPAASVEAALDTFVSNLAGTAGAKRLGAAATAGAPASLAAGSIRSQLDALLALANQHATSETAHPAAAVTYGGGPAWRDGTSNPATAVEAQLDKLLVDLIADAGAARVGVSARAAWPDTKPNPAGSIQDALAAVVADLSAAVAGGDGAGRVGARESGNLPAGTIRAQLDALDATSVRTNVANVFGAPQTLNGADGDANAALVTAAAPVARKLLWDIKGQSVRYRLYAALASLELTVNARWNGTQWERDVAATSATKLELGNAGLRLVADDRGVPFGDDAWAYTFGVAPKATLQQIDAGGVWTSPGPIETYAGWKGATTANLNVGTGVAFPKKFPATPSSVTFVELYNLNITTLGAFNVTQYGCGVVGNTANSTAVGFFVRVLVS